MNNILPDDEDDQGYFYDEENDPSLMETLQNMEYYDSLKWSSLVGFILDNPKAHFKISVVNNDILRIDSADDYLELNMTS